MELIHTCYRITDIDRSVAFYSALGFEERARMPIREEAINVFMGLPGDGDRLELTYNFGVDSYEVGTGYGHIAITVDDMDGTLAALAEQGIEPERPKYQVREGGSFIAFVRDPDGYRVELIERRQDRDAVASIVASARRRRPSCIRCRRSVQRCDEPLGFAAVDARVGSGGGRRADRSTVSLTAASYGDELRLRRRDGMALTRPAPVVAAGADADGCGAGVAEPATVRQRSRDRDRGGLSEPMTEPATEPRLRSSETVTLTETAPAVTERQDADGCGAGADRERRR